MSSWFNELLFNLNNTCEFTNIVFSSSIAGKLLPAALSPSISDVFTDAAYNGIYIGKTEYLNVPVFWNRNIYQNGHCCIVGMTGSGKTYFAKTFVARAQFLLSAAIIIIDWTGEYVSWSHDVGGKIIDMSSIAFSMLPEKNDKYIEEKISDIGFILSLLANLNEDEYYELLTCIKIFMNKNIGGSKNQVLSTELIGDYSNSFLDEFYAICSTKCSASTISKLKVNERFLKPILSYGQTIEQIIRDARIICFDFSKLQRETERVLLAHMVLHLICQRMRFNTNRETFIVIDEAWKILKKRTTEMLIREGRKYSHHILFASQNVLDFDNTIFSNFASFFIFKTQSHIERLHLEKFLLLDKKTSQRLAELNRGQCFCKFNLIGKPNLSFFIKTIEGEEGIVWYILKEVNDMEIQIERDFLIRQLIAVGFSAQDLTELINILDSRRGNMSVTDLCSFLKKKNISHAQLIGFLRSISIRDDHIVNILADLHDKESNLVDVELDVDSRLISNEIKEFNSVSNNSQTKDRNQLIEGE